MLSKLDQEKLTKIHRLSHKHDGESSTELHYPLFTAFVSFCYLEAPSCKVEFTLPKQARAAEVVTLAVEYLRVEMTIHNFLYSLGGGFKE